MRAPICARAVPLQQKRDALERKTAANRTATHAFTDTDRAEFIETLHCAISTMQYGARTLRGNFKTINVLQCFIERE